MKTPQKFSIGQIVGGTVNKDYVYVVVDVKPYRNTFRYSVIAIGEKSPKGKCTFKQCCMVHKEVAQYLLKGIVVEDLNEKR